MTHIANDIEWSGRPMLAPFSWKDRQQVLVSIDVFAPEVREAFQDRIFAVMALCQQHQFCLVTDFPERFDQYVRKIVEDRSEWLTWRVEASSVLHDLGRGHEATGHGPVWPLKNVGLADFRRSLN